MRSSHSLYSQRAAFWTLDAWALPMTYPSRRQHLAYISICTKYVISNSRLLCLLSSSRSQGWRTSITQKGNVWFRGLFCGCPPYKATPPSFLFLHYHHLPLSSNQLATDSQSFSLITTYLVRNVFHLFSLLVLVDCKCTHVFYFLPTSSTNAHLRRHI